MTGHVYLVELLPNGFYRISCRRTQMAGLYHVDGTPRSGSLTYSLGKRAAADIIARGC